MCTLKTLGCAIWAMDTIQLERLVWAVFDNVMGPGKMPQLSGFKTYGQILRHLVDKAYKGLHMFCPVHTSTSFCAEVTTIRLKPGCPEPEKSARPERYSFTRDMRKEFTGSFSTFKDKQDSAGGIKHLEKWYKWQTQTFML